LTIPAPPGDKPSEDVIAAVHENQPIYEVYKLGYRVNAPAEIQWMIRGLADEHGYDERYIIGLIVAESTFRPCATNNGCNGLAQIKDYWLRSRPVEPYRLTDDYASRDLLDPYHNLLTLIEIWNYARDAYDLDTDTELGMTRLLYWHNTGRDPGSVTGWAYATRIFGYVEELVSLEAEDAVVGSHSAARTAS